MEEFGFGETGGVVGSGLTIGEGGEEAFEVVSLCGDGDRIAWRLRGVRWDGLSRSEMIGICGGFVDVVFGLMTEGNGFVVGMIGIVGVLVESLVVVDVALYVCLSVVVFVVLLS